MRSPQRMNSLKVALMQTLETFAFIKTKDNKHGTGHTSVFLSCRTVTYL